MFSRDFLNHDNAYAFEPHEKWCVDQNVVTNKIIFTISHVL